MRPVPDPIWLDRSFIDAMQFDLLRRHGGEYGIRDGGLIDSALARPRQRWAYDPECDFAMLAAAYAFGLAKNHGYVDGNKRIAYMAMYTFLAANGFVLDVPEPEAVMVMLQVACGEWGEDKLASWVREQFAARALTVTKRDMTVHEAPPEKTIGTTVRKKTAPRRAVR